MAKCSKKRRRRKGCSRCGGLVEHGLFMSIYLHSRSFGGQMYLAKYNTYIENLGYTFEHVYTARYGKSLRPLAHWYNLQDSLQVLLVLTWFQHPWMKTSHFLWFRKHLQPTRITSSWLEFRSKRPSHANTRSSEDLVVNNPTRGGKTHCCNSISLLKSSSQHKQAPNFLGTQDEVGSMFILFSTSSM